MFGEGTGGAVAAAATVLVPTRFVWTHGGRRVHLCGSFTRWQETLPMSPMEGLPSVFQVVCSLPPGYHQYKFIVDGEWRHDDQQSVMPDPLGNVNNWVLVREPELSSVEGLGQPGANMDVDHDMTNQAVQHHVHGSLLSEVPALSDADAEASRQRIAEFLHCYTAYELLPESGKVVALDIALPVKQAFHALYEQGITAAPLWDSDRQQFVGMLSASDFIMIVRQLGSHGAMLSEEDIDTHTIGAWKEEKLILNRDVDTARPNSRRPLLYVGPDNSLREVADSLLRHEVTIVPVLHFSLLTGSVPQLLHLASLSGVLKCICRHFRHVPGSLPLLSQPVGALPVGSWVSEIHEGSGRPLTVLGPDAPLNTALALLLQTGVSALPIVDDNGSLLDMYSRSDITALARDRAYARLHLDELTVSQALQIGAQDWGNGPAGPVSSAGNRCHMCLRSESLRSVMERLAHPGVRRLICIEAGSNRVEGIISLRDVFNFLLA